MGSRPGALSAADPRVLGGPRGEANRYLPLTLQCQGSLGRLKKP